MALEHISGMLNRELIERITKAVKEREDEELSERNIEALSNSNNQEKKEIMRLGGLRAYKEFRLDNFEDKEMLEKCKDYPNCNLYIHGPIGCGKTHLAVAVGRQVPEFRVVNAIEIFRSGLDWEDVIWRYSKGCVLIDDLWMINGERSRIILYGIINRRWMNKENGLIITSNYDLIQLSEITQNDKIASLIAGLCKIIKLEGRDRRIK